jgi:hypothetical protein
MAKQETGPPWLTLLRGLLSRDRPGPVRAVALPDQRARTGEGGGVPRLRIGHMRPDADMEGQRQHGRQIGLGPSIERAPPVNTGNGLAVPQLPVVGGNLVQMQSRYGPAGGEDLCLPQAACHKRGRLIPAQAAGAGDRLGSLARDDVDSIVLDFTVFGGPEARQQPSGVESEPGIRPAGDGIRRNPEGKPVDAGDQQSDR